MSLSPGWWPLVGLAVVVVLGLYILGLFLIEDDEEDE